MGHVSQRASFPNSNDEKDKFLRFGGGEGADVRTCEQEVLEGYPMGDDGDNRNDSKEINGGRGDDDDRQNSRMGIVYIIVFYILFLLLPHTYFLLFYSLSS